MRSIGFLSLLLIACASAQPELTLRQRFETAMGSGEWAEAYLLVGDLVCDHARIDDARELVRLWERVGRPGSIETRLVSCAVPDWLRWYTVAMAKAVAGNSESAVGLFHQAANELGGNRAMRPQLAEIRYRLGMVLALNAKHGEAIQSLELAAAADPARVDIRIALARSRLEEQGPEVAVDTLRSILALAPTAREVERARQTLSLAVEKSQPPLDRSVEAQLAQILSDIEKDRVEQQTAVELRAELLRYSHPRVKTVLGLVMMKLGRLAEGTHYLSEAADDSPIDPEPPRSLGTTLHAAGRIRAALPYLNESARRDPFDAATLRVLAEAAAASDDFDSAAQAYERLAVLRPLDPDNYLWIARMERRRGNLPSARLAVVRGCELVKRSIPLYLERASIEAEIALSAQNPLEREQATDRTKDAVAALLDIAPGHPGAQPILDSLAAVE